MLIMLPLGKSTRTRRKSTITMTTSQSLPAHRANSKCRWFFCLFVENGLVRIIAFGYWEDKREEEEVWWNNRRWVSR